MTPNAKRKLTLVGTALALCLSTPSAALAGCDDPAGFMVNWSGCDKTNAKLTRANLSRANLRGADLTRADLYKANLSGTKLRDAKLSGANLTNANLTNTNLWDANLTGATWTDGRKCAEWSIGECK